MAVSATTKRPARIVKLSPAKLKAYFEAKLAARMKRELPKDKEIISYCWDVTCTLSTKASYVLACNGYRAREMVGGIEAWKREGFGVERG